LGDGYFSDGYFANGYYQAGYWGGAGPYVPVPVVEVPFAGEFKRRKEKPKPQPWLPAVKRYLELKLS